MKYYAGIGARDTPQEVLNRMTKLSAILQRKGLCLRSGGAKGADTAFEAGVTNGNLEVFLANGSIPLWANIFTEHFHPNPNALQDYPRKLMNRNAMQILGRDGDNPVEFVVCWTADGKFSGGSGHALRIAAYFDIPIYNFFNPEEVIALKEMVSGI